MSEFYKGNGEYFMGNDPSNVTNGYSSAEERSGYGDTIYAEPSDINVVVDEPVFCIHCGAENRKGTTVCQFCGLRLTSDTGDNGYYDPKSVTRYAGAGTYQTRSPYDVPPANDQNYYGGHYNGQGYNNYTTRQAGAPGQNGAHGMFGAPGGYGGSQQYSDPRTYNNSQPYNNQYGRTNININFNQNNNQNMYVPAGAKNKWVTFFLTLFLGWIGVHRFYEGKIGSGLLWMFTLGLGGFGYFVDLIINFVRLFSRGDYYNP